MKKIYSIVVWTSLSMLLILSGCSYSSYLESSGEPEVVTEVEDVPGQDDEADTIFVQVAGAVKQPGVFELEKDARVFSAIEAAGGLRKNADESGLNQAALLTDGQKIYVASEGETAEADTGTTVPSGQTDGRVNINTADSSTLTTLSGIGEAKAAAIISYREAHSGFTRPEDLMEVDGIGEGTFEKLKEQITI